VSLFGRSLFIQICRSFEKVHLFRRVRSLGILTIMGQINESSYLIMNPHIYIHFANNLARTPARSFSSSPLMPPSSLVSLGCVCAIACLFSRVCTLFLSLSQSYSLAILLCPLATSSDLERQAATRNNKLQHDHNVLQHHTTSCNKLQQAVTSCNKQQQAATSCNKLQLSCNKMQYTASLLATSSHSPCLDHVPRRPSNLGKL